LAYEAHKGENKPLAGFTVHDPNSFQSPGEARFLPIEQFKQISTRRVITITPAKTK